MLKLPLACIIPMVLVAACVSPGKQAGQPTAAVAIHTGSAGLLRPGEPISGNPQAREAWWPIRFADQNQCIIQGYPEGTDAFAQCVRMTIDQQSKPHRCIYCRSLD
jgi:hypothetical protein